MRSSRADSPSFPPRWVTTPLEIVQFRYPATRSIQHLSPKQGRTACRSPYPTQSRPTQGSSCHIFFRFVERPSSLSQEWIFALSSRAFSGLDPVQPILMAVPPHFVPELF